MKTRSSWETLELIDDVEQLGLGYRFEGEIMRALDRIVSMKDFNGKVKESLHAAALSFRLLREHGYEVPQDVFSSFKDQNGDFKASLCEDAKGMLSLYEASFLGLEGENLLDKAKAFTRIRLKGLDIMNEDLVLPLHWRMKRLEARQSIETYIKRENTNQALLELAVVDFNRVQSAYQKELQEMSRWWRGLGLSKNLSFARDRPMECYFWSVGMVWEPKFSIYRKSLTKLANFITIIDDVYDVYGTLDELQLFTDAVERWDVNIITNLPDYMKLCFLALYNTVNEMAYDILKEKGEVVLPYLTKAWVDLCKSFLQEAKWSYDKRMPKFEEYLENACVSSSGPLFLVHAYFLLGQNATKQELDYLENYGGLLWSPSLIFRLCNDFGTSKAELERGDVVNGITCYMHHAGVSEDLARKHLSDLIEEAWRNMNKDGLKDGSPLGKLFAKVAFDLARIAHCHYQYGDGHGSPDGKTKAQVKSLLIQPIRIAEKSVSLLEK